MDRCEDRSGRGAKGEVGGGCSGQLGTAKAKCCLRH